MKHFIFNAEKAIRNGASFNWAKDCAGQEVKDGKIGDTPYFCSTVDNLRKWCDCINDGKMLNKEKVRGDVLLLGKLATTVGGTVEELENNDFYLLVAIYYYDCRGVICDTCPFNGTGCISTSSMNDIYDWLNKECE